METINHNNLQMNRNQHMPQHGNLAAAQTISLCPGRAQIGQEAAGRSGLRSAGAALLAFSLMFASQSASAMLIAPGSVSGTASLEAENMIYPTVVDSTTVAFPDVYSNSITASISGSEAEMQYELKGNKKHAEIDVEVRALNGDGYKPGTALFDVSFTTTDHARFSLTAENTDLGWWFQTTFNGLDAKRYTDPGMAGGVGGNFPENPVFGGPLLDTYTATGFLPAGTHTFTVEAMGFGPYDQTAGNVNLTLHKMLTGDLDLDGFVGVSDLNLVLANFNQPIPPGDPMADADDDGYVGISDLNAVLSNWNRSLPPSTGSSAVSAAVPEPASLALMATGMVMVGRKTKPVKPAGEPESN